MKVTSWGSWCHHWPSRPKKLPDLSLLYTNSDPCIAQLPLCLGVWMVITADGNRTDRCTEESVGEEQLVLWVAGLGRDAQVEEAYPSLQLAGEVHGLRGQPLPH